MAAIALTKCIPAARHLKVFEGVLDFANVAINTTAPTEQAMTVAGVLATDMVIAFACTDAGMTLAIGNVRVTAANTVGITLFNADDAAVDLAGTLNFRLIVAPAV